MKLLLAHYFDGKTSTQHDVAITFLENGTMHIAGDDIEFKSTLDDITISSRIGNTPRILTFEDGSVAHCNDNDAIDDILQKEGKHSFAHILESKMRYVVLSGALLLLSIIFFLTTGSDIAAKSIAKVIPYSLEKKISDRTLEVLDDYMLEKSDLSEKRKEELTKLFQKLTNHEEKYHLHFRQGIGENAFALPSGDIVLTDELVRFSQGDNDMIFGVLAHEMGHVVHKHSMQLLVKASIVGAVTTYFTGDVSSLAATLSTSTLNANYSRDAERQADAYAKKKMKEAGISPSHLAKFFQKIGEKMKEDDQESSYFASHPSNKERIENLLK